MSDFRQRGQTLILFNLSPDVANVLLGPGFDKSILVQTEQELESKLLGNFRCLVQ